MTGLASLQQDLGLRPLLAISAGCLMAGFVVSYCVVVTSYGARDMTLRLLAHRPASVPLCSNADRD